MLRHEGIVAGEKKGGNGRFEAIQSAAGSIGGAQPSKACDTLRKISPPSVDSWADIPIFRAFPKDH